MKEYTALTLAFLLSDLRAGWLREMESPLSEIDPDRRDVEAITLSPAGPAAVEVSGRAGSFWVGELCETALDVAAVDRVYPLYHEVAPGRFWVELSPASCPVRA